MQTLARSQPQDWRRRGLSRQIPCLRTWLTYPRHANHRLGADMNLKKIFMIAAGAFLVYYVLRSPDAAAGAFKGAGETTIDGLKDLADSLARFVDALFT